MLRKWSYNFHSNCHNTFWTLKNCPMRFDTLDNTRKSRRQCFFRLNDSLFLKTRVFNNLLGLKKCSDNFHSNCQSSLCSSIYCLLRLITLKNTQNFSSSWKELFFEMFVSIDFLVLKNWSYYFHSNCQNTLWTFIKCFLRLSYSMIFKKVFKKIFFTRNIAFIKNSCFQQLLRC